MKKQQSIFTLTLMGIFGVLLVAGVVAFSSFRPESEASRIGSVDIWGYYDRSLFDQYLIVMRRNNEGLGNVRYTQFSEDTFDIDVLEAMASGRSPDLLFVDQTRVSSYLNKVYTLTSESYSKRIFQENFVELAEIYFQNNGIVGIPLAADPLVMYWNRDLFSSAGLARPPRSWPEFFELSSNLSIVDDSLGIRQSAIAFGETSNVNYFKEIIATLLFQIGNPVITVDGIGRSVSTLRGGENIESAFPVLRFFTEFSDASKAVYSWNRSLPSAQEQFLSGKLAVYFAPASEIVPLRQKNPNLNFAVAEIPAVDEEVTRRKSVHASLYGFMIPNASDNIAGAFNAALLLTNTLGSQTFMDVTNLAPVRRDVVSTPSDEVYQEVLKTEAIYARTFADPNARSTDRIFSSMIEYITSGQRSIDAAISVSHEELNDLLER